MTSLDRFSTCPKPGKHDYLYLGAIDFIKSLKKGAAFGECCPMLNDISQLPSWKKVNTGMQRLYEGKAHYFYCTALTDDGACAHCCLKPEIYTPRHL